ncbi:DUF2589 domain-containing protein [Brachyspira sp. G79]|uniref:DUF2589 domain-containing protein n=1 Tax=Brachyspira sp. G79 TaxID=1358104 RepID=UPI000BBCA18F|nr:DUF2589 domain-containing protein [Brachyspira sp. G79]PCG20143.1 hypothetical protein KQ44_09040 [Brachyspira sp. G79]
MAKFNDVIIAIAKSVAEAQAQLEETQVSNLSKYFKRKKNRNYKDNGENKEDEHLPGVFPIRLKIGMPDENNKYGNKYYCVPYINLIPISQLNIDSIKASFDIAILDLIEAKKETDKSVFNDVFKGDRVDNMSDFNNSSDVSVDLKGAGINKDKGTNINIEITIKKSESSEGMSKFINEITNLSQGFLTVNKNNQNDD